MVKSFSIAKKPRVLFGVGLTTEAPKELKKAGCKNIFVLSDPVLKKMGAFQPLYDALPICTTHWTQKDWTMLSAMNLTVTLRTSW